MMPIIAILKKFIIENLNSIFSFITIGLLTSLLYFSLFLFLWKLGNLNYNIAVSIAYVLALTFYFFTNRHFTFKNHQNSVQSQLLKFIVMACINYLITILIVHNSVELLTLPPYIGMVLAIGTTTVVSYLIAKFWVFKTKRQGEI